MNLYWGDIHNHCGITYGYGSLKNALARAKSHLDFCAVTGHAMWPDMPERTEETAFVVDFHRAGFKKLRNHWQEISEAVAAANSETFVTFQSYEMHSNMYGDHHIISPDDNLPLIYRDSPQRLREDCGCAALTVAHHIGYTPGYRGINWDKFDENITPLIEVYSKHGCAMSETAPYPYYHNMGPRDSRNTVYEGLRRGKHFGFVGSTDHHAGFPGSYGDGKMAVWAEEKTRKSIWEAMLARRTYAVTGDRIECEFSVNGHAMGEVVRQENDGSWQRRIDFSVRACYPIDKIVVYKNLKPFSFVEGLFLESDDSDRCFKFRVEMGWGNSDLLYTWHGAVRVVNGSIKSVEPCWRGRSVLAPSGVDTSGYDDVNDIEDAILTQTETETTWQCATVRNISPQHPMTDSVIVEVCGCRDTAVTINVNGCETTTTIGKLIHGGWTAQMKKYHSHAFKVHPAVGESEYAVRRSCIDEEGRPGDFYHMEVIQRNASCAFVTPVWF